MKRKRDDEDENRSNAQALPVADLPDSFDGEPEDGAQYLFTVRRNARSLPRFTRVEKNPYEHPQVAIETEELAQQYLDTDHLPSDEWRSDFISHFKNLRSNICQPTTHIGPSIPKEYSIPSQNRPERWWSFIVGDAPSQWGDIPNGSVTEQEERWDEDVNPILPSKGPPRNPCMHYLKSMSQATHFSLIKHHMRWLHRHSFHPAPHEYMLTPVHMRWLFANLACLDQGQSGDEIHTLRTLAREYIAFLAKRVHEPSDEMTVAAWIIVAIVAGNWAQHDLWDDAASAIRKASAEAL